MREQVTISIASKDRPEVVEETLRKIHDFGMGECPLILCDDGSSPPLSPPALSLFPGGRLLRNEAARGQALARNQIAQECKTPYLLQLDDDSYPVWGSLEDLMNMVTGEDGWLAIAIPFEEPARSRFTSTRVPSDRLMQVKSFVGCSVLFRVDRLRELGGYASWVGRMVEEEELSIRALASGLGVYTISRIRIRHEVSGVNRNPEAIVVRCYRNWCLTWLVHAPFLAALWRVAHLSGGALLELGRTRRFGAVIGLLCGFRDFRKIARLRRPVSWACYREFRELPHALEFFESSSTPI